MTREYISLDLETTGLNPEKDAIIEIGAVRFKEGHVLDRFETLINPGRAIPHDIYELTGISSADVVDAPPLFAVLPKLRRFAGSAPIVGHNIKFDLSFLHPHGLLLENTGVDTFELASILLPFANRYGLSHLLDYLELTPPEDGEKHRALFDADMSRILFEALLDRARQLNPQIIRTIARLAQDSSWPLETVFNDLHQAQTRPATGDFMMYISQNKGDDQPLKAEDEADPIDPEDVASYLQPDGLFAQHFKGFEHRPQQVQMVNAVTNAFNESQTLVVEAGTGTGKSLAYLLPAIHWGVQNQQRVVVSTNTINLQDQLLGKDIPTLQQILPFEFKATVLKGRSNYVCPRRVEQFIVRKPALNRTELRLISKLLVWLPQTKTGDKEELVLYEKSEQQMWWQFASDGQLCTPRTCSSETCFYARAKKQAEASHAVIVNHALLLADVATDGHVIPEYRHLIIDEAHHLEDSITSQLTFTVDQKSIEQLLSDLSQPGRARGSYTGLIADVVSRVGQVVPGDLIRDMDDVVQAGHGAMHDCRRGVQRLFGNLLTFISNFAQGDQQYAHKTRLYPKTRRENSWVDVTVVWEDIAGSFGQISQALGKLYSWLADLEMYDPPDWEEQLSLLSYHRKRIDEIRTNLHQLIAEPSDDRIYWVQYDHRREILSVHNAPLRVGELFANHILSSKEMVVLTSATLQTNNSFAYFRHQLSLEDAVEQAVGSPFNYRQNAMLYVPTDMPEPNQRAYLSKLAEGIVRLAQATNGRMLVLFTSYSQLRQTADLIQSPLSQMKIALYKQGHGMSRRQMIDNFKSSPQAVMLGTRSFWEGVDIPGEDLQCVVITRLPFAVPTDPVISARAETYRDAFGEYSIPVAILTFRQGFGRLIRTNTDRGIVAVFDSRVFTKRYGHKFIDSLPDLTKYQGTIEQLPPLAEGWLKGE